MNKKYKLIFADDASKEAIDTGSFSSKDSAINYFAARKSLSQEDLLKLFKIVQIVKK